MPVTEKDIANLGANSIASNNTSSSLKKQDNKIITYTESNSSLESDEISKNPFLDPKVEEYYRDLYEDSNYESYRAFDPQFTWSKEEENKVIKKINLRVALTACILFVGLQVDRGNLQQAVSDNL